MRRDAPGSGGRGGVTSRGSGIAPAILALLLLLTAGLFLAHRALPDGASEATTTRPNIVLLLADDLRFDAFGHAGHETVRTPNLDRLAASGVRFENAFCTTSICPVSRASFLTGQYASRHGVLDFGTPLSDEQMRESWIGVLAAHGYQTLFVGKWGLGGELPSERFDHFQGFAGQGRYQLDSDRLRRIHAGSLRRYFDPAQGERHLTAHHADAVVELLGSEALEEPFLLQVSFKAPHAQGRDEIPFPHDPRFDALYADAALPLPPSHTAEAFARLPARVQSSLARERWFERFSPEARYRESLLGYYRLIAGLDDAVGRIAEAIDDEGLAQRTVVIFSSDNGFLLGEHGLAGKWLPAEESIRIPLWIVDPRLPSTRRGSSVPEMTLNIDVAPTILDLAGISVPDRMQGRTLSPLLRGEDTSWRRAWYYELAADVPGIPASEAIRTGEWKLVRWLDEPVVEQLFDLRADPLELDDRSADPGALETLHDLRSRLDRLREAAR